MQLFAMLVIMVASYLLSSLTRPKQHPQENKPALDSDFTFPQPDEGTKQAVIFGEAWLPNWAVLWHGNYRSNAVKDHGTDIGQMYFYSMMMGLCRGPINEVLEIRVADRAAYVPVDDNKPRLQGTSQFVIDAPTLFGGTPQGQGGIVTHGWFLNGDADQVLPAQVHKIWPGINGFDILPIGQMMPGALPGYRGMATMFIDGYVAYNNTNPNAWQFRVRRHTAGWDGAVFYQEKAIVSLSSGEINIPNPQLSDPNITEDVKRTLARTVTVIRQIEAMNPAHALIEIMTNRSWGRGLSLDLIDSASYRDAADILYDEGMGFATKWDRQGTVEDFAKSIIDYIGAAQYQDPRTGLYTLHLIRGDYNVDTIPTFSYTSGIKQITDNSASTSDNSINQVVITYTSPVTGKSGQVRAQNLASYTALDSVMILSTTYAGCPNADLAKRLAVRDLKSMSSGLRRLKIDFDRSAWAIVPGSVIKIVGVTDHKIETMVLRVGKRTDAGGTDGTVTLECIQDVFALDSTEYNYTVDTPPVWKPPVPGDTAIVPAPPLVSNLHLVKPWDGISFTVAWDRNDTASYYDVQVVAITDNNKVVRFRTHVMDASFTYTYDEMLADGGPWRSIEIQVRAVSYTDGTGPWFKQGLYNPQVRTLGGLQVIEAMKQAFFQYTRPDENDWVGTLVYISDTSGFVPDGNTQVYDGTDLFVTLTQLGNGTLLVGGQDYYIRAAGYDTFGKDSLNYTSEMVFSVVAAAPDANTIVSSMIKDGALEISKFARSIQPPLIVQGVPSAYAGSDVVLNQKDGKLYRWDYTAIPPGYTSATDAADIAGTINVDNLPMIPTDILLGLIPTTQLSGQITTGQIKANAIGADQIAAGAIIAGKLAAGSVQAGNMTANSVVAGTIAAGAVGATQIAANSVSTDKLLVGDMTNQLNDPDFSFGDLRSWPTGDPLNWSIDSTTPGLGSDGGKGVLVAQQFSGAAARTVQAANTRLVGASNGDIWYAAVQCRLNAASPGCLLRVVVTTQDGNGNTIGGYGGNYVSVATFTTSTVQVQITNPAVKQINLQLQAICNGGVAAGFVGYFDQVQLIRMSGVTLIQDGSIQTQKLAAASVTGDKIVGNTITGDKIVAGTITANLLQAGSISADKLMVGSGQNLVPDPGFLNGMTYFVRGANCTVSQGSPRIQFSNENYELVAATDQAGVGDFYCGALPCKGSTNYMFSAYLQRVGGTDAYIQLQFFDGNFTFLGGPALTLPQGANVPSVFSVYQRFNVQQLAPANATSMRFAIVHTGGGGTYVYHPQVEESLPNQTVPGPWSAAAATIIGPGSIQTGSLSAISANLGSITAGSLNINNLFIVNSAGGVLIRSAVSGQRIEMDSASFRSYDVNGTLRARMGNW